MADGIVCRSCTSGSITRYLTLCGAWHCVTRRASSSVLRAIDSRLLLVGNDLRKKGISVLLDAMSELRELPLDLLLVGREDPAPFRAYGSRKEALEDRVHFLPPRKDVEFYYAAADAYTGPSLEDTFALPPAEAMACGLPVIVSAENGTFEIITDNLTE